MSQKPKTAKKNQKKNYKNRDLDANDVKQVKGGSWSWGTPSGGTGMIYKE
jgi:hypothetical protein